jgi:hypothetical protein
MRHRHTIAFYDNRESEAQVLKTRSWDTVEQLRTLSLMQCTAFDLVYKQCQVLIRGLIWNWQAGSGRTRLVSYDDEQLLLTVVGAAGAC